MSTFIERSNLFLKHRESWQAAAPVSGLNQKEVFALAIQQTYADAAYAAYMGQETRHEEEFTRIVRKFDRSEAGRNAVIKNLEAMRKNSSI